MSGIVITSADNGSTILKIDGENRNVTLTDVTVSNIGGTRTHGIEIVATGATLTLNNTTLSGTTNGIYSQADNSTIILNNTTVTDVSVGIKADTNNATLQIASSSIAATTKSLEITGT
jgi:hypothetical protein